MRRLHHGPSFSPKLGQKSPDPEISWNPAELWEEVEAEIYANRKRDGKSQASILQSDKMEPTSMVFAKGSSGC